MRGIEWKERRASERHLGWESHAVQADGSTIDVGGPEPGSDVRQTGAAMNAALKQAQTRFLAATQAAPEPDP